MKIIFMGTPDFAVPSLKLLIENNYQISCVFTKPDKPVGRKQQISFSPVKKFALDNNLNIVQSSNLNDENTINLIKNYNPDLIVVIAYGKILPKKILEIPKLGCINVHGSLLPKYRGAAPIQWSIINGEKETGVTTMFMDEGLDTGDILFSKKVYIGQDENSEIIYDKLSKVGAELLIYTLQKLKNNQIQRIKQNDKEATYCSIINKTLGKIDWNKSSQEINNLIRGLNSWPVAYTTLNGKRLKIYSAKISENSNNEPVGKLISSYPMIVSCGDNTSLEILDLQLEGKKRMSSRNFVMGYKFNPETFLGDEY